MKRRALQNGWTASIGNIPMIRPYEISLRDPCRPLSALSDWHRRALYGATVATQFQLLAKRQELARQEFARQI